MDKWAGAFHKTRILEKCFWCLKTRIAIKDSYEARCRLKHSFPYVRALANMEQISKRFFALRKKSLFYNIRKMQLRYHFLLKAKVDVFPTFKNFIKSFHPEVHERSMTEQNLLLNAFNKRGTLQFKDHCVRGNLLNPTSGEEFFDPAPTSLNKHEVSAVSPGYTISKVKVYCQLGMGIVGWQLVWSADSCSSVESATRGKGFGVGVTCVELPIAQHDYIIGLQYISEGNAMTGLRFQTLEHSWTQWIGSKPDETKKRTTLTIDMIDCDDQKEEHFVSTGRKEDMYPGLCNCYVVGFGGVATTARATNMSLIVRKVIRHSIFSYYWVNEAETNSSVPSQLGEEEMESMHSASASSVSPMKLPSISQDKRSLLSTGSRQRKPAGGAGASLAQSNAIDDYSSDDDDDDDDDLAPSLAALKKKKTLMPSEDQFFDIIRMRMVEIYGAEQRAIKFARKIWSSPFIRKDPTLSLLSSINICTKLSKWFFESLCRSLVSKCDIDDRASVLYNDIHQCQVRMSVNSHRIAGLEMMVLNSTDSEKSKPWYGKSLITPALRSERAAFKESINVMKMDIANLKEEIIINREKRLNLIHECDITLPSIQLSTTVVKNFHHKILAARYKQSLMENMSISTLKEYIGGNTASFAESGFTSEDLTKISVLSKEGKFEKREYALNLLEPNADHFNETRITIADATRHYSASINANAKRNSLRKSNSGYTRDNSALNQFDKMGQMFSSSDIIRLSESRNGSRKQIGINPAGNVTPLGSRSLHGSRAGIRIVNKRSSTSYGSRSINVLAPLSNP
jgi:hypothetical protein